MNPPDPTQPRPILAPPVGLDGFEHVAAFTSPVDIGPLAALLKCYGRAYPDSRVTSTTADGWTFIIAPIDRPGGRLKWEGGAAATGGKGSRGEAPEFFSGGSAPAPADAGTADPTVETAAEPSKTPDPGPYAGHLVFGDVQRRRLHFEFDFMPPNCRLGSRWTVQPHSDEAAAAEIREAADHHDRFAVWLDDWRGVFPNEIQARAVFDAAQPAPDPLAVELAQASRAADIDASFDRFAEWLTNWGNRFRSDEETREAFNHAQIDVLATVRELRKELAEATDDRDRYRADLDAIGREIGCDHSDDGLARCVGETLETARANCQGDAGLTDLAVQIATFVKLTEWPEPGSEDFLAFAVLMEKLTNHVVARFPSIERNWKAALETKGVR